MTVVRPLHTPQLILRMVNICSLNSGEDWREMALAREIKGFASRLSASRLADQLFTPHGLSAYLEALVPGGASRFGAPERSPEASMRSGQVVHGTIQPATVEAPVDDRVDPSPQTPPEPPTAPAPTVPAGSTGAGTVRFGSSGLEVPVPDGDTTILALAEENGLAPRYRCRRGICGTCTTTKTSGVVRDRRTGDLSEVGETPIRICVSVPCGDVSLAL